MDSCTGTGNRKLCECLSHGPRWRSPLQFVINYLRRTENLNEELSRHFRVVVCTCQNFGKLDPKWRDILDDDFQQACQTVQKYIQAFSSKQHEDGSANATGHGAQLFANTLLNLIKHSKDSETPNLSEHGLRKLMVVLAQIYTKDFKTCDNASAASVARIGNVSSHMFAVDLRHCYTGLLVGKQGKRFKEITRTSGCKVNLNPRGFLTNSTSIEVKLKGSDNNVKSAKLLLQAAADEIFVKRQIHEAWVKEYLANRDQIRMSRLLQKSKNLYPRGIAEDIKNWNRADYERKQSGHVKFHSHSPKVKGHVILAAGSRCLNCLGPFDSGEFHTGACQYHPGFVVQRAWSCCGLEVAGQHPTHENHRNTGCAVSVHNWRPHQRRSGKNSLNSAMREARLDLRL